MPSFPVLGIHARIPADAVTAERLGTERSGSGVLIHENGLVITVGRLVYEAEAVELATHGGASIGAEVLGYDLDTGYAVLQAHRPPGPAPVEFGQSTSCRVGDRLVLAAGVGTPRHLSSILFARSPHAAPWEFGVEEAMLLRPAHPCMEGVGCLDRNGHLVGLGYLGLAGNARNLESLGIVLPIELLLPVLDDLVSRGRPARPSRPWLGLYLDTDEGGVFVRELVPGGPAACAGIGAGDRIAKVGDVPTADLADFYRLVWGQGPAGVPISLTIRRGDDVRLVRVDSMDRAAFLRPVRRFGS